MTQGSRWGWLTCLEILGGWAEDGGGAVQEWVREKQYRLGCRCGREVLVEAREFKGKRGMRSCGLEGCTYKSLGWELESTQPATATQVGVASMGEGVASMPHQPDTPLPAHTRLGRPPIYKTRGSVVNYYLPPELSDWVKVHATHHQMSASAVVVRALIELRDREQERSVRNG